MHRLLHLAGVQEDRELRSLSCPLSGYVPITIGMEESIIVNGDRDSAFAEGGDETSIFYPPFRVGSHSRFPADSAR